MSIMIRVWDLWVRLEKYVNSYLGKKVRKILQAREVAKADAFLKEFRKQEHWFPTKPEKCSHLKGGKHRRLHSKDYALGQHTFSDGRTKIWCLLGCGLVAWSGDKNFQNLTKMMELSSNTASSSERTVLQTQYSPSDYVVTVQDRIPNGRT